MVRASRTVKNAPLLLRKSPPTPSEPASNFVVSICDKRKARYHPPGRYFLRISRLAPGG